MTLHLFKRFYQKIEISQDAHASVPGGAGFRGTGLEEMGPGLAGSRGQDCPRWASWEATLARGPAPRPPTQAEKPLGISDNASLQAHGKVKCPRSHSCPMNPSKGRGEGAQGAGSAGLPSPTVLSRGGSPGLQWGPHLPGPPGPWAARLSSQLSKPRPRYGTHRRCPCCSDF